MRIFCKILQENNSRFKSRSKIRLLLFSYQNNLLIFSAGCLESSVNLTFSFCYFKVPFWCNAGLFADGPLTFEWRSSNEDGTWVCNPIFTLPHLPRGSAFGPTALLRARPICKAVFRWNWVLNLRSFHLARAAF